MKRRPEPPLRVIVKDGPAVVAALDDIGNYTRTELWRWVLRIYAEHGEWHRYHKGPRVKA